ncbi:hypothetical protein [Sulfitobacter sp. DFL-23]|uniref:hypothetical protein n=1 Tax=Sulfitobacter sp. DFL-23 TaxID=215829 RepID=UPI001F07C0FC|nr:hypothetical protein [Sulfitobacter sp. DFL-23]
MADNHRDLPRFCLAISSKLRGCDLVKMKAVDVTASSQLKERASVLQADLHTIRSEGRCGPELLTDLCSIRNRQLRVSTRTAPFASER